MAIKHYLAMQAQRLNGDIKRRTDEVGFFPTDAIVRLLGALLLEQNDERAVQRARYVTREAITQMSDDPSSACSRGALISPAMPNNSATDAASYATRWEYVMPS